MFGKHLADQYVGERACALGQKPFQSEYGYTSISQAHGSTYSAYFCLSAQQAQLFTACERDSCQQPLRSSTMTRVQSAGQQHLQVWQALASSGAALGSDRWRVFDGVSTDRVNDLKSNKWHYKVQCDLMKDCWGEERNILHTCTWRRTIRELNLKRWHVWTWVCNEQQVQAISSTKLCASSSYFCIFFDVE